MSAKIAILGGGGAHAPVDSVDCRGVLIFCETSRVAPASFSLAAD
jgi:hypothetical protein